MTVRLSPNLGTRRPNSASPEAAMVTAGSVAAKRRFEGTTCQRVFNPDGGMSASGIMSAPPKRVAATGRPTRKFP